VVRTPDSAFANLPGYPFASKYVENLPGYAGLRMHYLDEGPANAREIFLCLHGEPSWSYLYREMIPIFTAAGIRVVAPDLFGFGRSDKPTADSTYTFTWHRNSLIAFIERLNLTNVTMVCQDWGGILGLTIPMDMQGRFVRLLVMNTMLGTGTQPLSSGFLTWRNFVNANPDLDVASVFSRSSSASAAEAAAYGAPFPDINYKAGVRRFPNLAPDDPNDDGAAISQRAEEWYKTTWSGQSFLAVGLDDAIIGLEPMNRLQQTIRGAPPLLQLSGVGHFVQEDAGAQVATAALQSFGLG
jgi:haloalkane dehalogenase/tRNA(adenine34) deaminase